MSAGQLFINNPYVLSQNANVYGSSFNVAAIINHDYIFSININSLTGSSANGITNIFSNATFRQNQTNYNNYDINITLANSATFTNWSTLYNNQAIVQTLIGASSVAFGTFKSQQLTLGESLLEVIAHKLFGHAQANAAISNDNIFYNHDAKLWNQLSNSVALNQFKNDIFNQYVALGRYNTFSNTSTSVNNTGNFNNNSLYNDYDQWVPFNFVNLTFDFPLYVNGTILLNSSLTTAEMSILNNGPNVGGTLLVNGSYNIPILVRFHN